MEIRSLGSSGLKVSALGLGCMGMSEFYEGRDEQESLATLERAAELGVTFFDTADMYGSGANETLLRPFLARHREEVTIATKFGVLRGPNGSFQGVNGRPDHVRSACDASLSRLGVDVIDLYYQHTPDKNVPIEETVGAMAELVAVGKVRYLGLSNVGAAMIRRAHAVHPIAALQGEYSLWTRDPEAEILPLLRELGIGFVPYSPLGRGFLTGRFSSADDVAEGDWRANNPRFQADAIRRNSRLLDDLGVIATDKGCTLAQLALAWVLAQSDDIVPIPGTKRRTYLEENVGALDVTLTAADLARIDEIMPQGAASGAAWG
ncbi:MULTISPECIES: aldo/keto reductase [unclassified Sphingomonas]|uniref:aldo/keto reductase n=1 Tax=unclassified Sphingomonas TaxID=196159 RepID=UPI0022699A05|nr:MULTISPECIES: aldo/keto reductase [unclassified Sphingomonas]